MPEIWDELKLPSKFEFQELSGTDKDIRFALDNFGPMMKWPERASIGYFFQDGLGGGRWVLDAQKEGFREAPILEELKRDLNAALSSRIQARSRRDWEKWLDSMTYQQYLVNELGLSPKVLYDYVDPYFGSASFGVSGDAVSAYGAYRLQMPATGCLIPEARKPFYENRSFVSFPGGNTVMLRCLVKAVLPEAIEGGTRLGEVALGATRFRSSGLARERGVPSARSDRGAHRARRVARRLQISPGHLRGSGPGFPSAR